MGGVMARTLAFFSMIVVLAVASTAVAQAPQLDGEHKPQVRKAIEEWSQQQQTFVDAAIPPEIISHVETVCEQKGICPEKISPAQRRQVIRELLDDTALARPTIRSVIQRLNASAGRPVGNGDGAFNTTVS
jgi:hypothetical protein